MPGPVRDGHYPYQAPIDAYGNGGFRFADMSHRGSLLCLPSGMHAWEVSEPAGISESSLSAPLASDSEIEVFFLGTGEDIVFLDPAIRALFSERGIIVEPMSTGAAVRTYNVMLGEKRPVGAGLIAVERAKR
ncbi:Mth938-like domain-containing protein [Cucumibacter marinus]|uniref:Mth938-like domain-containing protein n=1 Tax=Cucumibacter marinus TaxID=1121252 RepID=UPI0003F83866|nr:MTH938/NDUFAF3 family protein [Cucumibacter marinus]